jgi:paraquat-inducible protein B
MTPPEEEKRARVLRGGRFPWIWVIPIIAVVIVLGIGWREIARWGPTITLTFEAGEGIQAGQTKIRRKDVDLGTVESVYLSHDLSRVIVRAQMLRSAAPYLTSRATFWIVRPRVSAEGISGLNTLVSGVYIEMSPGQRDDPPRREFAGLEQPPALAPDVPGRSFTLHASQLSSLGHGSAIYYRGLAVGEVYGYTLNNRTQRVDIFAFVRAPYDKLVHPETRFWNASGVDVTVGAQGVHMLASSWQELLGGGVEFSTPASALAQAPSSRPGAQFRLFEDKYAAEKEPLGAPITYRIDFTGTVSGIQRGTPVELLGSDIGEVRHAQLEYDDHTHALHTPVIVELDPTRVKIINGPDHPASELAQDFEGYMEEWVHQGLRARLTSASFLTGQQIISLDMVPNAAPARIETIESQLQIPSAPGVDISQILQSAHDVLRHIDRATAGPELSHAIKELDRTLTHLDKITADAEPQIQPLIKSLRDSAAAAERTLEQAGNVLGSNAAPANADLPHLMEELSGAARSIKALADYLDRHPEALIRGKKPEPPP